MSGLRRLQRGAGRAATFMRRLDQALDPLRQVTVAGRSPLIGTEQRLEPLTGTVDPFATLARVVDGVGSRQEPDASRPRITRRSTSTTPPFACSIRPAGARAVDPIPAEPLEPGGFAAEGKDEGTVATTTRDRSVDARTGPSRRAGVEVGVRHRQAISPEPATVAAASQLLATAAAKVEAAAPQVASGAKPRGAAPRVSASAADAILVERMRAATTLEAFRTVVRISSPNQPIERVSSPDQPIELSATHLQDRTAEPPVAGDDADLRRRSPRASTAVDRVQEAASLVGSARRADPQTDMPPRFSPRLDDVRDAAREVLDRGDQQPAAPGGRPSWLAGDTGLTGLRRLAALATESLGDPVAGEPAVRPVVGSESALPLDEELERILRSEALSHGIDLDGRAR